MAFRRLRTWRPRPELMAIAAVALLAASCTGLVVGLHGVRHIDFAFFWAGADIARTRGWAAVYDGHSCRTAFSAIGIGYPCSDLLMPPPTFWLVAPLTFLPLSAAFVVWNGLAITAYNIASWLQAPGQGWTRAAWMALPAFSIAGWRWGWLGGQSETIAMLGAALCIYLMPRRPALAGTAALLMAVKPQYAVLLPVAFLATDRRALWTFVGGVAVLLLMAAELLGRAGLRAYLGLQIGAPTVVGNGGLSIAAMAPGRGVEFLVLVALGALSLYVIWRLRAYPSRASAAAIAGSFLLSPYIHLPDLLILIPAAWTWAASEASRVRLLAWALVAFLAMDSLSQAILAPAIAAASGLLLWWLAASAGGTASTKSIASNPGSAMRDPMAASG